MHCAGHEDNDVPTRWLLLCTLNSKPLDPKLGNLNHYIHTYIYIYSVQTSLDFVSTCAAQDPSGLFLRPYRLVARPRNPEGYIVPASRYLGSNREENVGIRSINQNKTLL